MCLFAGYVPDGFVEVKLHLYIVKDKLGDIRKVTIIIDQLPLFASFQKFLNRVFWSM